MGKVIVMNGLTLDGVMQSPDRPEEDPRGGFEHGGWGVPYGDETLAATLEERLAELTGGEHAWLFGRRSYDEMLTHWNAQGGPFKESLNNTHKYVASGSPETRLEWPNSTLLHGDVPAEVADLKRRSETTLVIMGSGVLIGSLMTAGLVDEYLLTIAPLVLGTGRRMFPEGVPTSLALTRSTTTSKGVIVAAYRTA